MQACVCGRVLCVNFKAFPADVWTNCNYAVSSRVILCTSCALHCNLTSSPSLAQHPVGANHRRSHGRKMPAGGRRTVRPAVRVLRRRGLGRHGVPPGEGHVVRGGGRDAERGAGQLRALRNRRARTIHGARCGARSVQPQPPRGDIGIGHRLPPATRAFGDVALHCRPRVGSSSLSEIRGVLGFRRGIIRGLNGLGSMPRGRNALLFARERVCLNPSALFPVRGV